MAVEPPFIVGKVVEPPYFIDREAELGAMVVTLSGLIENQVVMAQRRMGKSSLLHNVAKRIEETTDVHVAHVDCRRVTSPLDFTDSIIESILEAYAKKRPVKGWLAIKKRLLKDSISDVIKSIQGIGVKAIEDSFNAYIEFREKKRSEASMLEEAFTFLQAFSSEKNARFVVILDEFQELRDLPGEHVFQLFKSYSDQLDRVRFVFSGSSLGLLNDVFHKPESPMYMMAGKVALHPLQRDDVQDFIQHRFHGVNIQVTSSALEAFHSLTGGIPHYVQKLGLVAWLPALQAQRGSIDISHVHEAFDIMLYEFGSEFEGHFSNKFGAAQRAILTALSTAKSMTRIDIANHAKRSTGQLSPSLNGLEDAMAIVKEARGVYAMSDPVFAAWIRQRILHLP